MTVAFITKPTVYRETKVFVKYDKIRLNTFILKGKACNTHFIFNKFVILDKLYYDKTVQRHVRTLNWVRYLTSVIQEKYIPSQCSLT